MREFDSAGLREMARVLQISTGPPQLVEIDDEVVQQVVELDPFLRRGLTPANSTGIFTATILNTHVGSDTITTEVNPYTPGTTFVGNGYPAVVGPELDVWLLPGFNAKAVTGLADFNGGDFGLIYDTNAMGWRNEANGIAVRVPLAVYDQEDLFGNPTYLTGGAASGQTVIWPGPPIRLRRTGDPRFRFQTRKAGAGAGSYLLSMLIGLFPAGMGQDVA